MLVPISATMFSAVCCSTPGSVASRLMQPEELIPVNVRIKTNVLVAIVFCDREFICSCRALLCRNLAEYNVLSCVPLDYQDRTVLTARRIGERRVCRDNVEY